MKWHELDECERQVFLDRFANMSARLQGVHRKILGVLAVVKVYPEIGSVTQTSLDGIADILSDVDAELTKLICAENTMIDTVTTGLDGGVASEFGKPN